MKRFGEKLRALRTRNGMSLRQLAAQLGLSVHGYIAQIERGERQPTPDLIVKIARLFQVSADQLMMDELELGDQQNAPQETPDC
ncbi:MAG: helix-turn-helix transcriptional regulator [Leptolyngbyaceae cyanobacterium CSU_1_3]|nr:helix-turn-helix transcriptional regulator [Leptolyngbyaceae cyanobacterium CSU_1_3]